jgi:hypothetical protein
LEKPGQARLRGRSFTAKRDRLCEVARRGSITSLTRADAQRDKAESQFV